MCLCIYNLKMCTVLTCFMSRIKCIERKNVIITRRFVDLICKKKHSIKNTVMRVYSEMFDNIFHFYDHQVLLTYWSFQNVY